MVKKAAFWIGMALNIVGALLILSASDRTWVHLAGVLVVVVGATLALKNFRA